MIRIRRALQLVETQYTRPADDRALEEEEVEQEEKAGALALSTGMEGLAPVSADAKTYEIVVRMLVRAMRMGEAFQLVKRLRKETGAWVASRWSGINARGPNLHIHGCKRVLTHVLSSYAPRHHPKPRHAGPHGGGAGAAGGGEAGAPPPRGHAVRFDDGRPARMGGADHTRTRSWRMFHRSHS